MIKILCLVSSESEVLAIKNRIQDEIFACKELPAYQRWVKPCGKFYTMVTENCEIDFRLPSPPVLSGLHVDLVYGAFDCDYSDEVINMMTGKRDLGLQKKYGKSELPIWEIVLDIEKRYARVMEGMFKDENKDKSKITIDEWMQSPSQTLKKDVDKFVDILEKTSSIRLPEKDEKGVIENDKT